MKAKNIICLLAFVALFGCGEKKTQDNKTLFGQKKTERVEVKIHRFDKALFSCGAMPIEQYLLSLEKDFKPMFAASLSDKEYFEVVKSFAEDREMKKVSEIVTETYPDLKFLENELSEALGKIRNIRPDSAQTDIYTLIVGPSEYSFAYQNRILVYPEFSAISIDIYSIEALSEHEYYKSMPQYLRLCLTRDNIAPDYIRTYLREITFRDVPLQSQNPEATLLDCMVEEGKYTYAVAALLPKSSLAAIQRYTPEQQRWVESNEYNIWTYIIQNELLYNKDRTKYLSLIAEGPTTRGITDSPSRLGNHIGYRIVQSYMEANPISLDSLFKIDDAELILKQSKYKPEKK